MTIGKLTKIKRVVLFSTILIFSLMSYYQALITIQCFEQYLTPKSKWYYLFNLARISGSCHIRSRQTWTCFYDALSFEHPHYDISSSVPDKEYMEKVYKIATGGFKELSITQIVLEIYEMHQRKEWEGPDSAYDA